MKHWVFGGKNVWSLPKDWTADYQRKPYIRKHRRIKEWWCAQSLSSWRCCIKAEQDSLSPKIVEYLWLKNSSFSRTSLAPKVCNITANLADSQIIAIIQMRLVWTHMQSRMHWNKSLPDEKHNVLETTCIEKIALLLSAVN